MPRSVVFETGVSFDSPVQVLISTGISLIDSPRDRDQVELSDCIGVGMDSIFGIVLGGADCVDCAIFFWTTLGTTWIASLR